MRTDADLSMHGISRLVAEFMERLDLRAVTLVENDWAGRICSSRREAARGSLG